MGEVIIAADVGGTRTTIAVQVDGAERSRVAAAGAAVRPGRAMASAATIAAAARQALAAAGQIRGQRLIVGAAGAGREAEASELARALRAEDVATTVQVTTDLALALSAAFPEGPGVVLSAGTGSVAVARSADGTETRMGGYGWQMGDGGSGYDIGRSALMRVSLSHDGLAPATALEAALLAAVHAADHDALVRWAAGAGPREVASLAAPVLAAAGNGDSAARAIVEYAATQLSELVIALAKRSHVRDVALTGGLMQAGPLRDAVSTRLTKSGLNVLDKPVDPIAGAFRLALGPQP